MSPLFAPYVNNFDINDQLVVEKILKHLDLWQPKAHCPPVSKKNKIVAEAIYAYRFFDYLPE